MCVCVLYCVCVEEFYTVCMRARARVRARSVVSDSLRACARALSCV